MMRQLMKKGISSMESEIPFNVHNFKTWNCIINNIAPKVNKGETFLEKPTYARDSISRVSRMTGTVERTLGVGTVRISMTVMGKLFVSIRYCVWKTFIDIWLWQTILIIIFNLQPKPSRKQQMSKQMKSVSDQFVPQRTYLHTWLHFLSIPYDRYSKTIPWCWYS